MIDYYDDDDFEQDKMVFDRQKKFAERLSQEQALKDQANIFADALSQAGLDEKTFNELVQSDPQGVRKDFEQGVKEYVSKVARRRDAKGRFLPGKQTESVMGLAGRPAQPQQKRRFDPAKNRGTDEDMHNLVLDVLGDHPMFKM